MSKSLVDALGTGAWSVAEVVFDLNGMLDNEGRPISERRADAAARVGVEMDMRPCPYAGIRHGQLMNVSALAQISHYLNPVLAEMAAFRRQAAGENATWADILAGIVDLLAQPAIYLLQQRDTWGPVPAQMAVGHKLAAGYFGVLRGLHERLALGGSLPVTVDSLLNLVDEVSALVGASEACAGPPQMIRRTSTVLLEGSDDTTVEIERLRLDMARCLALQVQLGIFWQLYDRVHLWSLIRGDFRKHLVPCNSFLVRKLELAENDVPALAPARPLGAVLPDALSRQQRDRLAEVLRDGSDAQALAEDLRTASGLLNEPGSVIRYDGDAAPFALCVANYLNARRLFVAELSRLELELRGHLGFAADTPIRLGAAIFPEPQALPWYELILGRRLGADGRLSGTTTGVRVAATGAAA